MNKTNKISPYWICQLAGWGAASLYWIFWMIRNGNTSFFWGTVNISLTITTAIFITHIYYLLAKKREWHLLDVKQLVPIVLLALTPLAIAFMIANILIGYYTAESTDFNNIFQFAGQAWLTMFITGGRLMAIWLLAFHMYHYAKRGIEAETEKARLESMAKEAQLQNLKAQLNPHFLFNALNSVKAMILPEPEKARHAVVVLSDILRNSLNANNKEFVTLEEELLHVKDYLEMEKIRFEERLNIEYKIDKETNNAIVLPLSLQVLAENAIKHGISKKKEGGTIKIHAEKKNKKLHLFITNEGQLNINQPNSGIGLKNLKERLKLYFGNNANLEIKNLNKEQVIASVKTPLLYE